MQPFAVTATAVLLCLIAVTGARKSLFAFQVFDGDEADGYEVTFSFRSSVSGHGRMKKTTDSQRVMFDVELSGRISDEDVHADALVELQPAGSGYTIRTEARLQSAAGITATYLMQAHRLYECPRLVLQHNLTTVPAELFSFSSGLTETCDGENRSHLAIDMDLSSSLSHLIETHLQQVFLFSGDSGWESMNATNSAMDVAVIAEWSGSGIRYHHKKTAKFDSKIADWLMPSFSLEYENKADRIILCILKDISRQSHDEL